VETFVVETYLSRHVDGEPEATFSRMEGAVRAATANGDEVSLVRAIFIPDDETCLLVVHTSSREDIDRVVAIAGLAPIRISQAVTNENERVVESRESLRTI
jgi:hypothetical protein